MKPIFLAAICLLHVTFLFSQSIITNASGNIIVDKNGNQIVLGKCAQGLLMKPPFSSWYQVSYQNYKADSLCCDSISTYMAGTSVSIFFGTWCGDSKREVPRMVKLLVQSGIPADSLQLIAVGNSDTLYKKSPGNEEFGKNIVRVPTMIVVRKGMEIGRIIESPVESLERDLLSILSGKGYKPNYADRVVQ